MTPGASDSASFDEVLELLHLGGRPHPPRRADDDPRGVGEPPHHGPGPAGLLPLPRLAHGAVGRPGRRGLHRRHGHRRRARPQRAAPGPLLGDRRRPGGAGQRGRACSTSPPAKVVRKGRLQPGRMFLVDTGPGRIVDDDEIKADAGRRAPLRHVARGGPGRPRRPAAPDHAHPAARLGGQPPAAVRLHQRGAAAHRGPDGQDRRPSRSARWAHDTAIAVAVGAAAPALRLLHPALRPGDQPAARRHPRGAGHLAARRRSGPRRNLLEPTAESCRQIILPMPVIDNDDLAKLALRQRGRRDAGLPGLRHRRAVRGGRRRRGAAGGHRGRPRPGRAPPSTTGPTSSSCPTATRRPSWRRSRRCCWWRPSTTTWCAPRPGPGSAWWSSPATPARCTTWPCSWGSGPPPSTRTWPSRPSTT